MDLIFQSVNSYQKLSSFSSIDALISLLLIPGFASGAGARISLKAIAQATKLIHSSVIQVLHLKTIEGGKEWVS